MATYPVKITLEFSEEEVNALRPFFYIKDEPEVQLTNFIWETINEKTNIESMNIYNRLCFALTAYEADSNDPDYDKGYALYEDLVSIVNDMGLKLN